MGTPERGWRGWETTPKDKDGTGQDRTERAAYGEKAGAPKRGAVLGWVARGSEYLYYHTGIRSKTTV